MKRQSVKIVIPICFTIMFRPWFKKPFSLAHKPVDTIYSADETHGKRWRGERLAREKLDFVDGNVAIRQNGCERAVDRRARHRSYTRNARAFGNVAIRQSGHIIGGPPPSAYLTDRSGRTSRTWRNYAGGIFGRVPITSSVGLAKVLGENGSREGPEASSPRLRSRTDLTGENPRFEGVPRML